MHEPDPNAAEPPSAPPREKSRSSGWIFWLVIVAGLGAVVLGVIFAGRFDRDITLTASPLIGEPVPDVSFPLLATDGEARISDFAGDILVINFWASWCLSCRLEHPALMQGARDFADLGVTFIGIAYQDRRSNAIAFLDELGWGDPFVYGFDQGSRVAVEFGILGIPETFFVDRSGTVVGKVSGPLTTALLSGTLETLVLGESIDQQITTGDVQNLP